MKIRNASHSQKLKSEVKKHTFLCLLLCLFYCFELHSQNNNQQEVIALEAAISQLEQRWEPYKFTFVDDIILNTYVKLPPVDFSIEEGLGYLETQSNLTFTIINNNFIVINKKDITLQSLCGTVLNWETGTPLSKVFIKSNSQTTVTDSLGYFELEVPELNATVEIDHLGFGTRSLSLEAFKSGDCDVIFLYPKTEILDEVIINDFLTKGIGKTDVGSFQIDYSNFGILPGLIETDVLQTIQALPGVQSADETISNINIRGGTHDQNLILWDGIKMYQSGHFFGLISVFNPNITEKATVLKNGSSSEFTDGVSGSILMNSSREVNQDFKGNAGVNLINADIFSDIPIGKKTSLQISARKALSDVVETPTYTKYFERISQNNELENNQQQQINTDIVFDFYDVNLRWNYNISEKDKLRVNFLLIHDELFFTENAIIDNRETSRQSSLKQNSIAGGIYYERSWNDKFKTSLQVYETDYNLQAVNVNLLQQQRFLQENVVSETGVKLKSLLKINENLKLTNGYQLIETGVKNLNDVDLPIFRSKQVRVIRTHGLFSEINYKPSEKNYTANLGIRYTYNEKFKSHFIEPRISYNQKFSENFNLLIQGELKHQNTSQIVKFQNDFLGIEKRRWVLSNEQDIPVIKGKQISAGLHYNYRGWLVSGETYFKDVTGITAESQGFQNRYRETIANGSYTVKGFEFLTNKRFKDVSAWIGYSYAENNYDFEAPISESFPNTVDIRHSISLGAVYILNNLKISAGVNWHSGLPTTLPINNEGNNGQIDFEQENSSQLKNYFRADFSANYDFNITENVKAQAGVSVWNFLNNENIVSSFYQLNDQNTVERFDQDALKLTPNAVFRVSF